MFEKYKSNTYAGSCNNYMLFSGQEREITGRMLFRVCDYGRYPYSFYFCNTVDSTFGDGKSSHADLSGERYEILSAAVGTCASVDEAAYEMQLTPLTFGGSASRTVEPDERLWSDELALEVGKGDYLVFEWTVRGKNIPYTPDKMFPCFVKYPFGWRMSRECPQPCLVGCDRPVAGRIAFWGDSITQGLGTREDMYDFWVAKSGALMPDMAVWNLGLGYGRAQDAGKLGRWFEKAAVNDLVTICFGVNDIMQGFGYDDITASLERTVNALKNAGVRVGLVTIPPFDYSPEQEKLWRGCCDYIRDTLSQKCEFCYDSSKIWGMPPPYDHISKWYGHPTAPAGELLAKALVESCLDASAHGLK